MDPVGHMSHRYVPFLDDLPRSNVQSRYNKRLRRAPFTFAAVAIVSLIVLSCCFYLVLDVSNPSELSTQLTNVQEESRVPVLGEAAELFHEFEEWIRNHGKIYAHKAEKLLRFNIFRKNWNYIHLHNQQGFSYRLAPNEFADLTHSEFREHYVGYKKTQKLSKSLGIDDSLANTAEDVIPTSIDWREKGCVTEVKNQKQCGSCWAFSATGALEGAYCASTGTPVDLSEQQLVDCSKKEGTNGCHGGEMDLAFQFVVDNKGLCSESDYPYSGVDDQECRTNCTPKVVITGFKDIPPMNETALKAAVAAKGPVSVAIEADQLPFQFYSGGVFDASCGVNLDHGVLVVGYGVDTATKKPYWIVKNSWGARWGEKGYIRIAQHMGRAGECGILEDPSYPIISS